MALRKKEFDVLTYLERTGTGKSQRDIAKGTGMSVGSVNRIIATLAEAGCIVDSTDDWCLQVKNHVVTRMSIGGVNCFHMFGISYWNAEDGAKLAEDIKKVYEMPGGKERYWDQVPLEYCLKNYNVEIRPCTFDDIIEIDTCSDLKKLDSAYS